MTGSNVLQAHHPEFCSDSVEIWHRVSLYRQETLCQMSTAFDQNSGWCACNTSDSACQTAKMGAKMGENQWKSHLCPFSYKFKVLGPFNRCKIRSILLTWPGLGLWIEFLFVFEIWNFYFYWYILCPFCSHTVYRTGSIPTKSTGGEDCSYTESWIPGNPR